MKINEGRTDRIIRIIVGIAMLAKGLFLFSPGWGTWVVVALGAILLITGIIGFCPLYALLRMNTIKR